MLVLGQRTKFQQYGKRERSRCTFRLFVRGAALLGILCLAFIPAARAQRTNLKPGWNMFSPQQDVEVGKRAALDAEKQLPLCNAPRVDAYLTQLGLKLVAKLPTGGAQYPFEFHCVNDKAVNAFALPGGYVFINRGAIEAADNEAQLAGVMAHEISHVALRHGTSQATKAQAMEGLWGIVGGIFGDTAGGALMTQLGAFAAGGVLLRYSRTAESQADIMGTQVLYDTGYDPRALVQFFEKLEAETKGKTPPEFFSNHPSPEHRVERVDEEIDKLGGTPANGKRDSVEFEAIKREVLALPVVKKAAAPAVSGAPGNTGSPAAPSGTFVAYEASSYTLKYPDNWRKYGDGDNVSFAPDGGVVQTNSTQSALAYGMTIGVTQTQRNGNAPDALEAATQQFITELQKTNPNMRVAQQAARVHLNGQPGLSTYFSNDSPVGGQETDWVVTVLRSGGLLSFVCVAPQNAFPNYKKTFATIFDTVRFSR
jgi:Peptidase family M48